MWISRQTPALVLAPMEGVTDAPMRALLTERGGFSFCVSEFLRVSQDLLPRRVFFEHLPELNTQGQTAAGVPVQLQILGGHPELMAKTALLGIRVGARAVDINFGCPSPTVNRHDGGAALLRFPERIRSIVSAVRSAVPREIPVSAKLRLGWDNMDDIFINAEQAVLGGADWITIHARTKVQGYAPPAHWHYIREIRSRLDIPVVANGDIWSLEDFRRCRDLTGCEHFMIGRGALADPTLPLAIARELGLSAPLPDQTPSTPGDWRPLLERFRVVFESLCHTPSAAPPARAQAALLARMKQWLRYAHSRRPMAWFDEAKRTQSVEDLLALCDEGFQTNRQGFLAQTDPA